MYPSYLKHAMANPKTRTDFRFTHFTSIRCFTLAKMCNLKAVIMRRLVCSLVHKYSWRLMPYVELGIFHVIIITWQIPGSTHGWTKTPGLSRFLLICICGWWRFFGLAIFTLGWILFLDQLFDRGKAKQQDVVLILFRGTELCISAMETIQHTECTKVVVESAKPK